MISSRFGFFPALLLLVGACDDGADSGVGGSATTSGAGGTAPIQTLDTGACIGGADVAVLEALDEDAEIKSCVMSLVTAGTGPTDPGFAEAVSSCLADATGLSPDCAACHGTNADCGADQCFGMCIADSTAPDCVDCRCGRSAPNDCVGDFETCSGIVQTSCG